MISSKADTTFVATFPAIKTVNRVNRIYFSQTVEYARQLAYDIISIVRMQCYTETAIRIFKTYIETRIRCYIGISSGILADSYRVNKRKYGLH